MGGQEDGAIPFGSTKEVWPMSVEVAIALLMLVLAAIKLGYDLGKPRK